jgi:outer membrane protein assembly factor BamB
MQLANPTRNRSTAGAAPVALDILWQASAAQPNAGPLKAAWDARLAPVVTPPVAADGRVFVASTEVGQVKAFDIATGKLAWTVTLGSRIDSAPTILGNLCVIGARDGWVYAFTTDKGSLVWRTRVAPLEQRMVVNGRVESTWPAIGSVLVHDGRLIAHAGRSSEADGGIAVVQLDPATGSTIWAGVIGPGPKQLVDFIRMVDDTVVCNQTVIEPGSKINQQRQIKVKPRGSLMIYGYLRLAGMRGFKASPGTLAIAGDRKVIAEVLPDDGRVTLVEKGTTNLIAEVKLGSPPIHDGLAICDGNAFVALEDGRLLCLGSNKQPADESEETIEARELIKAVVIKK